MEQGFWIGFGFAMVLAVLAFCIYEWWDLKRIAAVRAVHAAQVSRITEPMVAYIQTLDEIHQYSEEGFRQFVRDTYGEERLLQWQGELARLTLPKR